MMVLVNKLTAHQWRIKGVQGTRVPLTVQFFAVFGKKWKNRIDKNLLYLCVFVSKQLLI